MPKPLLISRRSFTAGTAALGSLSGSRIAFAQSGKPSFNFGTAVDATSFLPVYVANARTWKEQGLNLEITAFRGDAECAQALASDSIDVSLQSVDGLINLIQSGQPIKAFYAGFHQADFSWMSQPAVKTWDDLKGKTIGVSQTGGLTDGLTRHILSKHKLVPGQDIQIVQIGPSSAGYQALKSGRLAASIQSAPYKWMGGDEGFNELATQARDVAPQWPKHVFLAKTSFVEKNGDVLQKFLRAHVAAIRLARADRAIGVKALMDRLKYNETYAGRAYDEVMPSYNERGVLPDAPYMDTFWSVEILSGTVKEAIPSAQLLDDRFIKSFDQWAPKA